MDENDYARIEKLIYDAYKGSMVLMDAINQFKERIGRYPKKVLSDQIYGIRDNRSICMGNGIRLSSLKLGHQSETAKANKKIESQDDTDRIEVERMFSLSNRFYIRLG